MKGIHRQLKDINLLLIVIISLFISSCGGELIPFPIDEGPLLQQAGNPINSPYEKAKTKWPQSKADIVLSYQYDNGAWPKNQTYESQGSLGPNFFPTIDNGATSTEIVYIAQVYQNTREDRFRVAVRKAMEYLLKAQYTNGGWPQIYPLVNYGGYSDHVTYNDNAMVRVLTVLHNAHKQIPPFNGDIFNDEERAKIKASISRGVDYIIKSQWKQNGILTSWCAQHGAQDYQPKSARKVEVPSLSGFESVEIVAFLMSQPQSPRIKTAVKSALNWFRSDKTIKQDYRFVNGAVQQIVPALGDRFWYRYYDLTTNRGFFSDQSGKRVYEFNELPLESRNVNYGWGGKWPETLLTYASSVAY